MHPTLPDAYTTRARIIPALIAAIPVFALVTLLVPWNTFSLSQALSSLSVAILLFALSDLARRHGRRIEPNLYRKYGGKPTLVMLRHRDATIDPVTKSKIVSFLAGKLQEVAPSAADEQFDPLGADAFYERAGTWLRENTRDTNRFNILFNENITYGYRRNLVGLKWTALVLNALVLIGCGAALWIRWHDGFSDQLNNKIMGVAVITCMHSLYLIVGVTQKSVVEASKSYARQLLLSCASYDRDTSRDRDNQTARGTRAR